MAIDFQQTGTASPDDVDSYCSGTSLATDNLAVLAEVGGTPGGAGSVTVIAGATRVGAFFAMVPASGVTWSGGDWTVRFNVTTSNMNMELASIHICRVNSAFVNQATIGSLTGLTDSLGTTGVITKTVSGTAQTPAANDRAVVILGFRNTNAMSAQTVGITSNQIITSPFTASISFSIDAQPGSFTVTGAAATVVAGRVVDAQPGSFALAGFAATLTHGFALNAEPGSFGVTGFVAALLADRSLSANPGVFITTGVEAQLLADRVLSADPGTFALTGFVADLVFTPVTGAFEVNAEPGAFTVAGFNAAVVAGRVLYAEPGSLVIVGADAALVADRTMSADPGAFVVTGAPATLDFSGAPVVVLQRRLMRRMASRTMILGRSS